MIDFIVFFLFFWWIMLIFYKLELPIKIYNKSKREFIDQLTSCEFCMESHMATILAIILAVIQQDYTVILYAPMSAALINILKK